MPRPPKIDVPPITAAATAVPTVRDWWDGWTATEEILENGDNGGLQNAFIAVIDRKDDPEGLIRQGNEWVIGARLADALGDVGVVHPHPRLRPAAVQFALLQHDPADERVPVQPRALMAFGDVG